MRPTTRHVMFCLSIVLSNTVYADDPCFTESCNISCNACRDPWVVHGCCAASSKECGDNSNCQSCENQCPPTIYTSLIIGGAFVDLESGGFNLIGGFPNTGGDDSGTFQIGGAIGITIPTRSGQFRLECEALSHDMFNSVTNSFQPPTPTFFYDVQLENRWSVMANLWKDIPVSNDLDVYFGGGLGTSGGELSVNDTVVGGKGRFSEFAWQLGTGVNWHASDHMTIDFGYRYVDFGTAELIGSAGNYTADLTAHQLQVGFRFRSIGSLFRNR